MVANLCNCPLGVIQLCSELNWCFHESMQMLADRPARVLLCMGIVGLRNGECCCLSRQSSSHVSVRLLHSGTWRHEVAKQQRA